MYIEGSAFKSHQRPFILIGPICLLNNNNNNNRANAIGCVN